MSEKLGLTITRVDFNLSNGEDPTSTHYTLTGGKLICHEGNVHTAPELAALTPAILALETAIRDAQEAHRNNTVA